jgi:hypothetical protein
MKGKIKIIWLLKSLTIISILVLIFLPISCQLGGGVNINIWQEIQNDEWREPDQIKRMGLVFENNKQNEDFANFPVLVVLNSSRVDYGDFKAGGVDIRFYDENTTTELSYEIEEWDTGGDSYIWVKVPTASKKNNTDYIWMYWGDSTAGDVQDPGTVWSEYKLVYHFAETSGTTVADSATTTAYDGTSASDLTVADSLIGNGIACTDAPTKQYVDTGYREDLTGWTVEALLKADAAPEIMGAGGFANGPIMGGQVYNIGWDHNSPTYLGGIQLRDDGAGWLAANLGTLEADTWYYLAGVYDSSVPNVKAYNNGVPQTTNTSVTGTLTAASVDVCIGVEDNKNNPINAIVDEVRISDQVRSAEWIEYTKKVLWDEYLYYTQVQDVN